MRLKKRINIDHLDGGFEMNKQDLIGAVAEAAGVTKAESGKVIETKSVWLVLAPLL
jgi:hypothetical protein